MVGEGFVSPHGLQPPWMIFGDILVWVPAWLGGSRTNPLVSCLGHHAECKPVNAGAGSAHKGRFGRESEGPVIKSQDVQFWAIRKREGRRKPYEVRWRVDSDQFSRSFLTKALAETYRTKLLMAARAGETFSARTGEPVSWEVSIETVYEHARAFARFRWRDDPDGTRRNTAEGLVYSVLGTLDGRREQRGRPADRALRLALRSFAFVPPTWDKPVPQDVAEALAWVAAASLPVSALADRDTAKRAVAALGVNRNGKAAQPKTAARRYSTLLSCMEYAVERKLLISNPISGLKVTRNERTAEELDPRTVPSLDQARRLLAGAAELKTRDADRASHLATFFAVMYYAGMRPSEVRGLRRVDLELPRTGWGRALLAGSLPQNNAKWSDGGETFTNRPLKHRARGSVRPVPLPPVLVALLRDHVKRHGSAPDGRVFFEGPDRAPISNITRAYMWERVRQHALTKEELAVGLAKRPYDLRHGHASHLLILGVPQTDIARRLGHSLTVLQSTYAHWINDMEDRSNRLIEESLSPSEDSSESTGQSRAKRRQTG